MNAAVLVRRPDAPSLSVVTARYPDDAALVAGLRAGDEMAFAELLERFDVLLRRVARRFVSTDAVAQEVVGDTWVAVIRGIDRFEGRSSLKTWLVRILSNQAMTRGAREARQLPFSSLGPSVDADERGGFEANRFRASDDAQWPRHWASDVGDWGRQPIDHTLDAELADRVRLAVADLPEQQRIVFTLRDIEGWTSAEVIDALQITEGNQRVLLHRGRGRVREALGRYFDESGGRS